MAPRDSTQGVREEPGPIGVFAGHWNVKGLQLKKPRYLKLRNLILLAHWSLSFDMHLSHWSSLLAQMVKNLPAMQETQVWPLSWKTLWRREWQHTSVFLPGEFHGQREEPGRLQSMGLQRVGHDWVTNTYFSAVWGWHPVFSHLESLQGVPSGRLWQVTEGRHPVSTLNSLMAHHWDSCSMMTGPL